MWYDFCYTGCILIMGINSSLHIKPKTNLEGNERKSLTDFGITTLLMWPPRVINGFSTKTKTTTSTQQKTGNKDSFTAKKRIEGCSLNSILYKNHEFILICLQGLCFWYHTNSGRTLDDFVVALLNVWLSLEASSTLKTISLTII